MTRPKIRIPRAFGRPGASAQGAYRSQRARLTKMTWKGRLAGLLAMAAAGAIVAQAAGVHPIAGAAIAASVILAVTALIVAPQALAVIAVLAGFAVLSLPLGAALTAAGSQGTTVDPVGGALSLMVTALVATWFAVRYSRGRPWVTLALALGSTIPFAAVLMAFAPELGLNAARIPLAVVLALRCGGWAWLTGLTGLGLDSLRKLNGAENRTLGTSTQLTRPSSWLAKSEAERATAAALAGLPDSFTAFHDVTIRKTGIVAPHVVIGPSGVALLASVSTPGPITESALAGVNIPGVEVGPLAASLLRQRRLLSKNLSVKETDIAILLVVHGRTKTAVNADMRRTLAVFDQASGELPTAHLTILGVEMLTSELDTGFSVWAPLTQASTVRRAHLKLTPALMPEPSTSADQPTYVATVGVDGTVESPLIPQGATEWVEPGTLVDIATSNGTLSGLRVVGSPYRDSEGNMLVLVCVDEEWQLAQQDGRSPQAHPYPVAALSRP
jgi:hypothetical protein